ncbi:MAG TPA: bifunctional riboflavin kinase/FAD synthetase [Actinomycetota bacterium]
MKVYRGLHEVPEDFGPSVVTIGVFDGVHRGHQALMHTVVDLGRTHEAVPTVATFDRHPLEVIAPDKAPQLLSTLPQRARLIEQLGMEALVVMTFDDVFRHLSPEEFVRTVLVDELRCVHTVVGANFTFGHKRAGTIETLQALGAEHGFEVTVFEMQTGAVEDVVSSTLIRRHLADGDVDRANAEMDHPYRLEGFVEKGAARGKGLGFPTANLRIPDRMLLPKLGVYVARVLRRGAGEPLPAVVNVGVNPTFEQRTDPVVEVHVLDFDEDLYGEVLEVEFLHRLRDEQRFPDADALVAQMDRDVADARAWFAG